MLTLPILVFFLEKIDVDARLSELCEDVKVYV